MKHFYCLFLAVTICFSSCEMVEYHPYDGNVKGETKLNRKNICEIEKNTLGKSTVKFIVVSDTHSSYDEVLDEVKSINNQKDIDFVIHCGDFTDFGTTSEFEWQQILFNKLNVPYVVVIGNHDCLGTGKEIYCKMFGAENFAFTAGKTRFICLNTNAKEYDFNEPVPKLSFLDEELAKFPDSVENTIVAMHIMPLADEFNNDVASVFEARLRAFPNILFCVCGHGHKTIIEDVFEDGLLYYEIACAEKRQYYIFTISGNSYDYVVVDF